MLIKIALHVAAFNKKAQFLPPTIVPVPGSWVGVYVPAATHAWSAVTELLALIINCKLLPSEALDQFKPFWLPEPVGVIYLIV